MSYFPYLICWGIGTIIAVILKAIIAAVLKLLARDLLVELWKGEKGKGEKEGRKSERGEKEGVRGREGKKRRGEKG